MTHIQFAGQTWLCPGLQDARLSIVLLRQRRRGKPTSSPIPSHKPPKSRKNMLCVYISYFESLLSICVLLTLFYLHLPFSHTTFSAHHLILSTARFFSQADIINHTHNDSFLFQRHSRFRSGRHRSCSIVLFRQLTLNNTSIVHPQDHFQGFSHSTLK